MMNALFEASGSINPSLSLLLSFLSLFLSLQKCFLYRLYAPERSDFPFVFHKRLVGAHDTIPPGEKGSEIAYVVTDTHGEREKGQKKRGGEKALSFPVCTHAAFFARDTSCAAAVCVFCFFVCSLTCGENRALWKSQRKGGGDRETRETRSLKEKREKEDSMQQHAAARKKKGVSDRRADQAVGLCIREKK